MKEKNQNTGHHTTHKPHQAHSDSNSVQKEKNKIESKSQNHSTHKISKRARKGFHNDGPGGSYDGF